MPRKPDPNFFLHACKVIGVKPEEVVFLDDIGMNLRAAKKLGMETIRKLILFVNFNGRICNPFPFYTEVKMGHSEEAIAKLEKLVDMDLHTGVDLSLCKL